jgi:hypothetical protein
MGCDWYSIDGDVACGILVSNKNIKERCKPGSSKPQLKCNDPLDDDTKDWLFQQTADFRIFNVTVTDAFILISKEELHRLSNLQLCGPYNISDQYFDIAVAQGVGTDELDEELLEVSRKVTPDGNKLSFQPGTCSFHYTRGSVIEIKREVTVPAAKPDPFVPVLQQQDLSMDLALLVGKGATLNTYQVNRAVLCCFVPGFDRLLRSDRHNEVTVAFENLEPSAVEAVINYHTTRDETSAVFPPHWGMPKDESDSIRQVYAVFKDSSNEVGEHKDKRARNVEGEPALSDPRWLDTTFILGPDAT